MKIYSFIFIGILFLCSCNRETEEELWTAARKYYDEQRFEEAIVNYQKILTSFPKSEKLDSAQLLIAAICNNDLQDYNRAIAEYKKFIELFPDNPSISKAMFLIGFIYNNQLHKLDSAKIAYEAFLSKFPDDELAPSAKIEIQTLGKDPSELILPEIALKDELPKEKIKSDKKKIKK